LRSHDNVTDSRCYDVYLRATRTVLACDCHGVAVVEANTETGHHAEVGHVDYAPRGVGTPFGCVDRSIFSIFSGRRTARPSGTSITFDVRQTTATYSDAGRSYTSDGGPICSIRPLPEHRQYGHFIVNASSWSWVT